VQPINEKSDTNVRLEPKIKLVIPVQLAKAYVFISLVVAGISEIVIFVQLLKANAPILVRFGGKEARVMLVQFSKACWPT
jgi:hypothetical protein